MTKKLLVEIAESQIGVKEIGGNNQGPMVRQYQNSTWLAPGAWPWCAAFTSWCLKEWLNTDEGAEYAKQHPQFRRCRDASAFGWIKWAQECGIYVTDEKELAMPGDFVVYDFSHIGIVKERPNMAPDVIDVVEGNTNGKGMRDSKSGDGVWLKRRQTHLVRAYLRL